jgi:hypothetical protein
MYFMNITCIFLYLMYLLLQFSTQATYNGSYFGLIATMGVYGYNLSVDQVSTTTIWITNLEGDYKSNEDAIWVGWQVRVNTIYSKLLLIS